MAYYIARPDKRPKLRGLYINGILCSSEKRKVLFISLLLCYHFYVIVQKASRNVFKGINDFSFCKENVVMEKEVF